MVAANRRYCPEREKDRSSLGCNDRHVSARRHKGGGKGAVDRCFVMEFRDGAELERELDIGLKQGPQAVIQLGSPLLNQAGRRVAEDLSARHMPGISQFRSFPDSGGLMPYGPDLTYLFRRLGPYIFKIL